ncbi:MAG TPA: cell division protein FtsA [Methanocella sp.]|nr:cell division protein FtsA [Methanocella sp.]
MAENDLHEGKLLTDGSGGLELAGAGFVDTGYVKKRSNEAVPIGLKIGSTRTVLVMPNYEGSLDIIRTLTCVARYRDLFTGKLATKFGDEAAEEYADSVYFMFRAGLPQDDDSVKLAAQFIEHLVYRYDIPENSYVTLAHPAVENDRGRRNLKEIISGMSIGRTGRQAWSEAFCGAIPAFDGLEAIKRTFVSVNMGSTTLEISAFRNGEPVHTVTLGTISGNLVDRKIRLGVQNETQGIVNIDLNTARKYKEEFANFVDYKPVYDSVHIHDRGQYGFKIEKSIMKPVEEYVNNVIEAIMENFFPQLAQDHYQTYKRVLVEPIILTGGMACIPGLRDRIQQMLSDELEQKITVISSERPDLAPAIGAFRISEYTLNYRE